MSRKGRAVNFVASEEFISQLKAEALRRNLTLAGFIKSVLFAELNKYNEISNLPQQHNTEE